MKSPIDRRSVRTWIEVSRGALEHNLIVFRSLLPPGCRIMAICKSNAYGHGLYDLAPVLEEMGADWFGVDSIVEAVTLRKKGIRRPILVLGHTLPVRFGEAGKYRISLTVSSLENLRALAAFQGSRSIRIHLKFDTGMHRQGLLPSQWEAARRLIRRQSGRMEVEGIYTHFASAKDPADREFTHSQIKEFEKACALFEVPLNRPIRHACATAGLLNYPEAAYELARIGIGLMGHWPSAETKRAWDEKIVLEPALTWRTIISEVKSLKKGLGIGYDQTETLKRDSRVGVCPIGYWHGFPRSLSRTGEVLVRGRRAKVLGTVSMDMIVVDLTGIAGARGGDVATVIGRDGREEITAYEVAGSAGVSHYEFLTRLNPLIQKIYT
ncbi:MAG: alanine racemase [Candidatus Aminicenantes bacterium]|nr:alanine racemase [Candidatus Aminicenantes bacterium]